MPNINITEVRLLAVPLENDYKHTLYFATKQEQINFFKSKTIRIFSNFSYQRKDNVIRVPDIDDNGNTTTYDGLVLGGANYVMYKNAHYSNKWYFAFITELKYVDDGRTDIVIETDCIQTWLFDYTVKKSFVERWLGLIESSKYPITVLYALWVHFSYSSILSFTSPTGFSSNFSSHSSIKVINSATFSSFFGSNL